MGGEGEEEKPAKRLSGYTRSGKLIPKLGLPQKTDEPRHIFVEDKMSLELHMRDVRKRVFMSDAEREWRRKYLLDQHLHPDEPIRVDAIYRQLSPLRKLYRWPWDTFYQVVLQPTFGHYRAMRIRVVTPKLIFAALVGGAFWYKVKYEPASWLSEYGYQVWTQKPQFQYYERLMKEDPDLLDGIYNPARYNYIDPKYGRRTAFGGDLGPPTKPW